MGNETVVREEGRYMTGSKIPRLIHYCWFGGGALSDTARCSLRSWRRFAPGFEIKRWDETNAPLEDCAFVHDAFEARKWAFVADYVRFWALYQSGGIYMDVGSELVKDISPLIEDAPFSAIERETLTVNAGLIVCCAPKDPIVHAVLDVYRTLPFIDAADFLRSHTVNEIFTSVLERFGYYRRDLRQSVAGWILLPSDYFDPLYGFGGFHIKKNTYSIHHSTASWCDSVQQTRRRIETKIAPFIGHRASEIIGRVIGEIRANGFSEAVPHLIAIAEQRAARQKNS